MNEKTTGYFLKMSLHMRASFNFINSRASLGIASHYLLVIQAIFKKSKVNIFVFSGKYNGMFYYEKIADKE